MSISVYPIRVFWPFSNLRPKKNLGGDPPLALGTHDTNEARKQSRAILEERDIDRTRFEKVASKIARVFCLA